jgi:hypothetical protein
MNVWRLVAHHEDPEGATEWAIAAGKVAVGWGSSGDLRDLAPSSATEISRSLPSVYPDLQNAHLGGPSLWNFFKLMEIGDLVIVSGASERIHVVEITGNYFFASLRDSFGDYRHQRTAVITGRDPDELWALVGSSVAKGNNVRWAVALCDAQAAIVTTASGLVYSEGSRFEVAASVVERNPQARDACLLHHGYRCSVCDMDFGERYGQLGKGFIHVHHLSPLAGVTAPRLVDPKLDLIPVCPNCHAMVHQTRPPLTIEELKSVLNDPAKS